MKTIVPVHQKQLFIPLRDPTNKFLLGTAIYIKGNVYFEEQRPGVQASTALTSSFCSVEKVASTAAAFIIV